MNNKLLLICSLLTLNLIGIQSFAQTKSIELKNNFFYINGEKTFLKGIGYEVGAIPGQNPWERTLDTELIEYDMNRILSAGFNTIRTWGAFTKEELDILKNFDINIIMGIWIDSHADFSNPDFINNSKGMVQSVLSYSKNYDNIIAYIIHNEPLPDAVFGSGYQATQSLWEDLSDIIQTEHPDRPVTIANTCVGSYIDPSQFDISAYNVYPYNPATINHSHGYAAYIEYLSELRPSSKPLIITEYGLSVSPTGPGSWGYGGNTLSEQNEGVLHMYSSLLDGGANGSCAFNYSDGWWKAGDPYTHNDDPEEWFGLVEYSNVSDKYGSIRPVWKTIKTYQKGLIISPRNSKIYKNKVPIELFINDEIDSVIVVSNQDTLFKTKSSTLHITDTIYFSEQDISDYVLNFRFLDVNSELIKEENITILVSKNDPEIPEIQITTNPNAFSGPGSMSVNFKVTNNSMFSISPNIDYVFYQHNGWEYGEKYSSTMNFTDNVFELNKNFTLTNEYYVVTFSAGFNINYGNFTKRVHSTKTMIKEGLTYLHFPTKTDSEKKLSIFPNPSKDYVSFTINNLTNETEYDSFSVVSLSGAIVIQKKLSNNRQIDVSHLKSGQYRLIIRNSDGKILSGNFTKL